MIAWFARNPVAANLLMGFIIVSGGIAASQINSEVFPEFELDAISVQVPYLGAAPEEVEEGVCVRIEEAIQGVDGIKKVTSSASEGSGRVMLELELSADRRRVVDDVKSRVDTITTFPIETEKPIIREMVARTRVIDVAVSGRADELTLKAIAERVRNEITAIPQISLVEIASARPYEISIEVSEVALRRHRLTFDDVATVVRRSSIDLPGGSVRTDSGEILLRTIGQAYRGPEYEELIVMTRADGTRLYLRDVATVVDGFAETDQFGRFDDNPTVIVSVFRTSGQSTPEISSLVQEYVDRAQLTLPPGISLNVWQDAGSVVRARHNLMIQNGMSGFVLVFIMLALFLELRLAFWVSLGIPVSFLGAIMLMPANDVTVNIMSLFAFILVLGIVVDDAIIVGENIYSHQERHGDSLRGSIDGAREIATPVIFAVLTTVAAFTPLMFVPGSFGKFFKVIPFVVIPCLLFSLLESLNILPAHLSHLRHRRAGLWSRMQGRVADTLVWFAQSVYRPHLEILLRWRYVTAAVGIAALILTVGMVLGGWIGFHFFPTIEADFMNASITMPQGTPAHVTSEAVQRLEAGAKRLRREMMDETGLDYFRHVYAAVGDQPRASTGGPGAAFGGTTAGHVGGVMVELAPAEDRELTSEQLGNRWREATGPIPEAVGLTFSSSAIASGEDLDIMLYRARHDRAAESGGRGESPAARLLRCTQHHGHVPRREGRDAARHQACRRDARTHAPAPRTTGATGVLRRGSPAHPTRARRHQGHGPLPGGRAAVPGRPREHAYSHAGRSGGAVSSSRRCQPQPRLRLDSTRGSQPCRQRLGNGR